MTAIRYHLRHIRRLREPRKPMRPGRLPGLPRKTLRQWQIHAHAGLQRLERRDRLAWSPMSWVRSRVLDSRYLRSVRPHLRERERR